MKTLRDFNDKDVCYDGFMTEYTGDFDGKFAPGTFLCRVLLNRYGRLFPSPGLVFGATLVSANGRAINGYMKPAKEVLEATAKDGTWKDYTEIRVELGTWSQTKPRQPAEQTRSSSSKPGAELKTTLCPDRSMPIRIKFELRTSTHTYDVELKSLERLTKVTASDARKKAMEYHVSLKSSIDLSIVDIIPGLRDGMRTSSHETRQWKERITEGFNSDQLQAYKQLTSMPEGNFFLPGSPGSGNTYWALNTVLIIHKLCQARVLYLMDINKPLISIAHRMGDLYDDLNDTWKVVRLRVYPERTPSQAWKLGNGESPSTNFNYLAASPDFISSFVAIVRKCRVGTPPAKDQDNCEGERQQFLKKCWERLAKHRQKDRVVSLDDAACSYLVKHQADHRDVVIEVEAIWIGGTRSILFLDHLSVLYAKTLSTCRFITATPVAAATAYFAHFFNPSLIVFDEAGHARELTTLIPAAFFGGCKAKIFIGDPKQSGPWVSDTTDIRAQLKVSLLERAVHKKVPTAELMINRRAYAGLHGLASALFYGNKMRSAYESQQIPRSVRCLRHYLDIVRGKEADIPRLLVNLTDSVVEDREEGRRGPDNPRHRKWALSRVREILKMPWFTSVSNPLIRGRILLLVTAKASCIQYERETAKWLPHEQHRLDIKTVDTAQGMEAELVILDIVKGSEFVEDKNRLCVALSRAIQGEMIIMDQRASLDIAYRTRRGPPVHLAKLWAECQRTNALYDSRSTEEYPGLALKVEKDKEQVVPEPPTCEVCHAPDCALLTEDRPAESVTVVDQQGTSGTSETTDEESTADKLAIMSIDEQTPSDDSLRSPSESSSSVPTSNGSSDAVATPTSEDEQAKFDANDAASDAIDGETAADRTTTSGDVQL